MSATRSTGPPGAAAGDQTSGPSAANGSSGGPGTSYTCNSLGATLRFEGHESIGGRREIRIDELWKADGIFNKKTSPLEILTEIRVPAQAALHRGAYGKLRDRGSIDFPLLGIAVRIDADTNGLVADADAVCVALQARPTRLKGMLEELRGVELGTDAFRDAAKRAALGPTSSAIHCPTFRATTTTAAR